MSKDEELSVKNAIAWIQKASSFCGEVGGLYLEDVDDNLQKALYSLKNVVKN